MEHRYPLFVAQATLLGYLQLREASQRWEVMITPEVIADAARAGIEQALARLYPGLTRPPFQGDPLPDVTLGLRYQFEEDPENKGLTWDDVSRSFNRRAMDATTPISSTRLRAVATRAEGESRVAKISSRPSIHPEKGTRHDPTETPTPLPSSGPHGQEEPTRLRRVGGGGVVFPWEKRNRESKGGEGQR